jgi:hypothetical protein
MKGKLFTGLLLILAAVILIGLQACVLDKVSIEERIQLFEDDLNSGDRSGIYENFHPEKTADYNTIKASTTIFDDPTSLFAIAKQDFSISITSTLANFVTGTITSAVYTDQTITFIMALKGLNDWRIEELSLTVGLDTITIQ